MATLGTTDIPRHLPRRLTITLWDFSWYTRTAPGDAFDDLDRACAEAVGARVQHRTHLRHAVPAVRLGP